MSSSEPLRWPGVVGLIGIVLAVGIFIDKFDDLWVPFMSESDWSKMLGPDLAELVVHTTPPAALSVPFGLVGMALAAFLFTGSIYLRRRRRSGVTLCKTWSWIAIGWVVIEMAAGLWWVSGHVEEISRYGSAGWQGYALFGIVVALAVMLAYPVFLIVWLSLPPVRQEYAGWA